MGVKIISAEQGFVDHRGRNPTTCNCNGNKVDLLNRYMLLRQVICSQMQLTDKKTIKDKSGNGPWILGKLAALIHSRFCHLRPQLVHVSLEASVHKH